MDGLLSDILSGIIALPFDLIVGQMIEYQSPRIQPS
jgi:hypothetical protein